MWYIDSHINLISLISCISIAHYVLLYPTIFFKKITLITGARRTNKCLDNGNFDSVISLLDRDIDEDSHDNFLRHSYYCTNFRKTISWKKTLNCQSLSAKYDKLSIFLKSIHLILSTGHMVYGKQSTYYFSICTVQLYSHMLQSIQTWSTNHIYS